MKEATLFLIQAPYLHIEKIWSDLTQMAQANDHIVVMSDAVLGINHMIIETYPNLYCLESDSALLSDDLKTRVKCIDYAQFAQLALQFKRCISLK
ncbi:MULTISPECIES: DsrH/TusB family sulfur metabolism protein [Acinetobacter]|uniref:DsrH/TusB family sulfur metabolism protein n=1 Tax=Acinetobacter TaxID=469 RepID=UPI00019AE6AF|nr:MULTISPECIES: DsrH/TusB family sulfur metabolism protein [Acinetobacter]EEH67526.1 hypothetical protein HMPREF0023_2932 [Acinetobacter sp. ATCC 27244]SUU20777.1 Uncharacterised protein [Acinetobacter haemolyticus]